jgi:hypothetical protein
MRRPGPFRPLAPSWKLDWRAFRRLRRNQFLAGSKPRSTALTGLATQLGSLQAGRTSHTVSSSPSYNAILWVADCALSVNFSVADCEPLFEGYGHREAGALGSTLEQLLSEEVLQSDDESDFLNQASILEIISPIMVTGSRLALTRPIALMDISANSSCLG